MFLYVGICLFIVVIISDVIDPVAARWSTINPGERRLHSGDTLVIRCRVTHPKHADYCTKHRRIFRFARSRNGTKRRNLTKRVTCRSSNTALLTLHNVTSDDMGLYWCGKDHPRNYVDVFVTDPLFEPKNITCSYTAKKIVHCNYTVPGYDFNGYNWYSCAAVPLSKPETPICNNSLKNLKTRLKQVSDKGGQCSFRCETVGRCSDNILMVIIGENRVYNRLNNITYCHNVQLLKISKPSPVRDIRVVSSYSSTITLTWRKPNDLDNRKDIYNYTIQAVRESEKNSKIYFTNITSKSLRVTWDVRGLVPAQVYIISVTAKPKKMGISSDASYIRVRTEATIPATGPIVPAGSYSYHDNMLAVYWKEIPESVRGGRVIRYEILSGEKSSIESSTKQWAKVSLADHKKDQFTIRLRGINEAGASEEDTVLIISKSVLLNQCISYVHVYNSSLVTWKHTAQSPDTVRIHRCFGNQEESLKQFVDCKTEIEHQDINDVTKDHMVWPTPPPPTLPCVNCRWQYAVSVHVNHTSAGMIWNTAEGLRNQAIKEQKSDNQVVSQILIIVIVSALLIAGVILICMFVTERLTCKNYVIILPKDWERESAAASGNTQLTTLPSSSAERNQGTVENNPVNRVDNINLTSSHKRGSSSEISIPSLNHPSNGKQEVEKSLPEIQHDVQTSQDDCADDFHGSEVSDYRMQIDCSATSSHDHDRTELSRSDFCGRFSLNIKDKQLSTSQYLPFSLCNTASSSSSSSSLSSSSLFSPTSDSESKQAASAYSSVTVPFLDELKQCKSVSLGNLPLYVCENSDIINDKVLLNSGNVSNSKDIAI